MPAASKIQSIYSALVDVADSVAGLVDVTENTRPRNNSLLLLGKGSIKNRARKRPRQLFIVIIYCRYRVLPLRGAPSGAHLLSECHGTDVVSSSALANNRCVTVVVTIAAPTLAAAMTKFKAGLRLAFCQ